MTEVDEYERRLRRGPDRARALVVVAGAAIALGLVLVGRRCTRASPPPPAMAGPPGLPVAVPRPAAPSVPPGSGTTDLGTLVVGSDGPRLPAGATGPRGGDEAPADREPGRPRATCDEVDCLLMEVTADRAPRCCRRYHRSAPRQSADGGLPPRPGRQQTGGAGQGGQSSRSVPSGSGAAPRSWVLRR